METAKIIRMLAHELISTPSDARSRFLEQLGYPVGDRVMLESAFMREVVSFETACGTRFRGRVSESGVAEPQTRSNGALKILIDRWLPRPERIGDEWLADHPDEWSDRIYPTFDEARNATLQMGEEAGFRRSYYQALRDAEAMLDGP